MKPYQKIGLYALGTSFTLSLIATVIPEQSEYNSYPIDTWCTVMSFVTGVGCILTAIIGFIHDNS